MKRPRFVPILGALAALVVMIIGSQVQTAAAAEGNNDFVTMQAEPQGYAGAPVDKHVAKQAYQRALEVITPTVVDPVLMTPGRAKIWNNTGAAFSGFVRVSAWVKVGNKCKWKKAYFRLTSVAGGTDILDLKLWRTGYRITVFKDTNDNGVLDAGDENVRNGRTRTPSRPSKRWLAKHGGAWNPEIFDVVIGTAGGGNEPPVTDYESYVKALGNFGYVTPTYSAPFYGQATVTIEIFLVSLGDQPATPTITDTVTRVVAAPANATSPSVFITTSGAAATIPAGHATGEFGFILDTPDRQIYQIRIGGPGGQTFNFWHAVQN